MAAVVLWPKRDKRHRRTLREVLDKAIVTDLGVVVGSGIRLRLNELSTEVAVEQLLRDGRITLPNTTVVEILPDNGGMTRPADPQEVGDRERLGDRPC